MCTSPMNNKKKQYNPLGGPGSESCPLYGLFDYSGHKCDWYNDIGRESRTPKEFLLQSGEYTKRRIINDHFCDEILVACVDNWGIGVNQVDAIENVENGLLIGFQCSIE